MREAPSMLEAFLSGKIDSCTFHHVDHVRVAYELLGDRTFPTAAQLYASALKKIARRAGNGGAYHETITFAFLSLVAERRGLSTQASFGDFAAANPDLLQKSVLLRWYTSDRLHSDLARRTFLLPDPAR